MVRLMLAATLGANYGIYGPAFELMEHEPREPGSEEYLDSEKYQLRALGSRARRFAARAHLTSQPHPARQPGAAAAIATCASTTIDNESLIAYSKTTEDGTDSVLVIVNLDPHHPHAGWLNLDLAALGLPARSALPGARPALRRALPVEGRAQLRLARPRAVARPYVPHPA